VGSGGWQKNEWDGRDVVVNIGRNPKKRGQAFYDAELHRYMTANPTRRERGKKSNQTKRKGDRRGQKSMEKES
jgi:hypothetical protein